MLLFAMLFKPLLMHHCGCINLCLFTCKIANYTRMKSPLIRAFEKQ